MIANRFSVEDNKKNGKKEKKQCETDNQKEERGKK